MTGFVTSTVETCARTFALKLPELVNRQVNQLATSSLNTSYLINCCNSIGASLLQVCHNLYIIMYVQFKWRKSSSCAQSYRKPECVHFLIFVFYREQCWVTKYKVKMNLWNCQQVRTQQLDI